MLTTDHWGLQYLGPLRVIFRYTKGREIFVVNRSRFPVAVSFYLTCSVSALTG